MTTWTDIVKTTCERFFLHLGYLLHVSLSSFSCDQKTAKKYVHISTAVTELPLLKINFYTETEQYIIAGKLLQMYSYIVQWLKSYNLLTLLLKICVPNLAYIFPYTILFITFSLYKGILDNT
jgi:hypothetical protein